MPKVSKKSTDNTLLGSLRSVIKEEVSPLMERMDDLEDRLSTKLRLTDLSLRTSITLIENKIDRIDNKDDLEKIHPQGQHVVA